MKGKRLCIIPCGAKKIWDKKPGSGPATAKNTYLSVFHQACQRYAMQFFDEWVILSAKHGFLFPESTVLENYDVAFNSKSSEIISIQTLQGQIALKQLSGYREIVVLGGKKYRTVVEEAFGNHCTYIYPLKDCKGIGYMLQKLNNAVQQNKEIHPKHFF